jgi:hypothetical protein
MPDLPARHIDRTALERVLAHAAELQAASADASDSTGDLTEEQVVELGNEVGLNPALLRQALAEERTRVALPAEEGGLAATLVGPGMVAARRVVSGDTPRVLRAVDAWMQREECLQVKRHLGDRVVWEARRDLFSSLRRGLNIGGRSYALTGAVEVSGTVAQLEQGRSLVTLTADLSAGRRRQIGSSAGAAAFGGLTTAALLAMGVVMPVALVPALALPGLGLYGARRVHHAAAMRAQLALEQLLDRLERGDIWGQPSIIEALAAAAAATLPRRP